MARSFSCSLFWKMNERFEVVVFVLFCFCCSSLLSLVSSVIESLVFCVRASFLIACFGVFWIGGILFASVVGFCGGGVVSSSGCLLCLVSLLVVVVFALMVMNWKFFELSV